MARPPNPPAQGRETGICNPSPKPGICEVSDPERRTVLRGSTGAALVSLLAGGGAGAAMRGLLGGVGAAAAQPASATDTSTETVGSLAQPLASTPAASPTTAARSGLGFQSVPANRADAITLPEGYGAQVLAPWGEPVGLAGAMPAWREDAGNSAADQAQQMGMHHDGLAFFALGGSSTHGLLVINHEYVDDGLLHADGLQSWSAEKVRKAQAAHGLSVIEVRLLEGRWQMVRPSRYARRLTASSPFAIAGPCAGHPLLRTAADPAARRVLGTLGNCASSATPWGTYLSGEENFNAYFTAGREQTPHQRRWGMRVSSWNRWHEFDERFDATQHANESNRFGWIVELDPLDPDSTPVKRTALGRAAHEGATVAVTRDGRAVVYSGEDAAFEYIYRFVSRDRIAPGGGMANRELLDHGVLSVARFDANGRGRWLPLLHGQGPLTQAKGFADQGEVLVKSRQASDLLGATPMDRPEWVAVDPSNGWANRWVYCTLTNNAQRGRGDKPAVDAANPRANNVMGHIIRWKEDGDFDGAGFVWNHFVLAGDAASERAEHQGNVTGDAFACPDSLAFGPQGLAWICSDMSPSDMQRDGLAESPKGPMARLGNNSLLACDVHSGEARRFMVGPVHCELAGSAFTPDGRTLFVSVQHPGEAGGDRSDPKQPRRTSNWPDHSASGRPRSAVVAVRRKDGGVVGS